MLMSISTYSLIWDIAEILFYILADLLMLFAICYGLSWAFIYRQERRKYRKSKVTITKRRVL